AQAAGAAHGLFAWVLIGAIALHVAGALKHALIDRDGTLARMVTGRAGP
ncbi:MAG: cytochrome b/b6 domain-containing protein, partial [Rhodobacterales bacterium]|nr:cytochrome b/b6 domain-containing protein [Rhodobacterales bacterium]